MACQYRVNAAILCAMSDLRDLNTVAMVAEHWGCSPRTVQRLIAEGALPCMRLGPGLVRLTRQQVEEYEAACVTRNEARSLPPPTGNKNDVLRARINGVPSRLLRGPR